MRSARAFQSEQRTLARTAPELLGSTWLEAIPGADEEIFDGRGGENLDGCGMSRHSSRDIDGHASDVSFREDLDLVGVEAGANLDAELAHVVDARPRAAQSPSLARRTSRGPVADRLDLLASKR